MKRLFKLALKKRSAWMRTDSRKPHHRPLPWIRYDFESESSMKSNPNISKVVCPSIPAIPQPEYHPIVLKATPGGSGDKDENVEFKSKDTQDTVMTAEPPANIFTSAASILMVSPNPDIPTFGVLMNGSEAIP